MLGPEDLTGLRIPDHDLRATDWRAAASHGQPGPVGAEREAPDMVLRTGEGGLPLPGRPVPQLDIRTALAHGERPARGGGDPAAVGAEGDRVDASRGCHQGQALGMAEPIDVVPLPAAALDRAAEE